MHAKILLALVAAATAVPIGLEEPTTGSDCGGPCPAGEVCHPSASTVVACDPTTGVCTSPRGTCGPRFRIGTTVEGTTVTGKKGGSGIVNDTTVTGTKGTDDDDNTVNDTTVPTTTTSSTSTSATGAAAKRAPSKTTQQNSPGETGGSPGAAFGGSGPAPSQPAGAGRIVKDPKHTTTAVARRAPSQTTQTSAPTQTADSDGASSGGSAPPPETSSGAGRTTKDPKGCEDCKAGQVCVPYVYDVLTVEVSLLPEGYCGTPEQKQQALEESERLG